MSDNFRPTIEDLTSDLEYDSVEPEFKATRDIPLDVGYEDRRPLSLTEAKNKQNQEQRSKATNFINASFEDAKNYNPSDLGKYRNNFLNINPKVASKNKDLVEDATRKLKVKDLIEKDSLLSKWLQKSDINSATVSGDLDDAIRVEEQLKEDSSLLTRIADVGQGISYGAISGIATGIQGLAGTVGGIGGAIAENSDSDVGRFSGYFVESLGEVFRGRMNNASRDVQNYAEAPESIQSAGNFISNWGNYFDDSLKFLQVPEERRTIVDDVASGLGQLSTQAYLASTIGLGKMTSLLFGMGANEVMSRREAFDEQKVNDLIRVQEDVTNKALESGDIEVYNTEKQALDEMISNKDSIINIEKQGRNKTLEAGLNVVGGGVTALSEALPLNWLRKIPATSTVGLAMKEYVSRFLAEGLSEGVEAFSQNAIERTYNGERSLYDGVVENFIVGGLVASSWTAGQMSVDFLGKAPDYIRRKRQSKNQAKELDTVVEKEGVAQAGTFFQNQFKADDVTTYFKKVNDTIKNSNMYKVDKLGALEFVEDATKDRGIKKVYLNSMELEHAFKDKPEQLKSILGNEYSRYEKTRQFGGDLDFTVAKFMSMGEHVEFNTLTEYARGKATDFSSVEMKQIEQDITNIMDSDVETISTTNEIYNKVADNLKDVYGDRFSDSDYEGYSRLITAWATRSAELRGITAEEFLNNRGLQFKNFEVQDQIERFKELEKSVSKRKRPGLSLLEFIAEKGGIIDSGGDMKSIGLGDWQKQRVGRKNPIAKPTDEGGMFGNQTRFNMSGLGLDEMAVLTEEAGYIRRSSDELDVSLAETLWEAIEKELQGNEIFDDENLMFERQSEDADMESFDELFSLAGVNPDDDIEAIRNKVERYIEGLNQVDGDRFFQDETYGKDGKADINSPEFKEWSDKADVVMNDEISYYDFTADKPFVAEVFHGSVVDFDTFDIDKASAEGDLGASFYFTSSESDVSDNYEGGGPDFDIKVERLAERIQEEEDIDFEDAKDKAMSELFQESKKYEVFIKMKNPVIIGDNETNIDYDYVADNYLDRDDFLDDDGEVDYESLNVGVDEYIYNNVIEDAVGKMNVDYNQTFEIIKEAVFELLLENSLTYQNLKEKLNESYIEDYDGNLYGNEATRAIFEAFGFDGIIDKTVSSKFRMNLSEDTVHFAVFNPNQIKSVYNRGTFSKDSDNIYFQDKAKGSINLIDDSKAIITVFKNGDKSTILHELGHLFWNDFRSLAKSSDNKTVLKDYDTMLKWVGSEDGNLTREQEELIARGFEAYLYEGKAPSLGLQRYFNMFRGWLTSIYKSIKALMSPLKDDVRGVFDRMLASEEEISNYEKMSSFGEPIGSEYFTTKEEQEYYVKIRQEAHDEAVTNLIKKELKSAQFKESKKYKRIRADAEESVYQSMSQQRMFILDDFLRKGIVDGQKETAEVHKLSEQELKNYGVDTSILSKEVMDKEGLDPVLLADAYGYKDVSEMVKDIVTASDRDLIAERMVEEFINSSTAEMITPLEMRQEAMQSVFSEKRFDVLVEELRLINNKTGSKVKYSSKAMKDTAKRIISEYKLGRASSVNYFSRSLAKATNEFEKALRGGQEKTIFKYKYNQVLAHALLMQAKANEDYVNKSVKKITSIRGKEKALGSETYNLIVSLMSKYGLLSESDLRLLPNEKIMDVATWTETQKEFGEQVIISEDILKGRNFKPFKDLTFDEFTDVVDAFNQIQTIGRQDQKVIGTKNKETITDLAGGLALTIMETKKSRGELAKISSRRTVSERALDIIDKLAWQTKKMEFLFREIDGYNKTGYIDRSKAENKGKTSWWETFYDPIQKANADEIVLMKEKTSVLNGLLQKYTQNELSAKVNGGVLGELVKSEVLSMALNWGNQGNKDALINGINTALGISKEDAHRQVLITFDRYMTKRDWDTVQSIWDTLETMRAEAFKVERDVNGVTPQGVDALEFDTNGHGVYKGGYYPIVHDPRLSARANDNMLKNALENTKQSLRSNQTTKHGHTKSRKGSAQPLLLDLGVVYSHVATVAHDVTHRRALANSVRVLKNPMLKGTIIDRLGKNGYQTLVTWIRDIGIDHTGHGDLVSNAMVKLRSNVVASTMSYNVVVATKQLAGIFPIFDEIGYGKTLKHAINLSNPMNWKETFDFVKSKSPAMENRINSWRTEIRDVQSYIVGEKGTIENLKEAGQQVIGQVDFFISSIGWLAGYEKGLVDFEGDEAKAVAYADAVVSRTQGTGYAKDLAGYQRTEQPLVRFLTYFSSWFNVMYNRLSFSFNKAQFNGSYKDFYGAMFNVFLMGSVADSLINLAWQGFDDDDDDKMSTLMTDIASNMAGSSLSMIPVFGSLMSNSTQALIRGDRANINFLPVKGVSDVFVGIGGFKNGVDRKDIYKTAQGASAIMGFPPSQLYKTLRGIDGFLTGDTQDPRDLVTGYYGR